jgi:two-component system, LytTR family, sensor kinase
MVQKYRGWVFGLAAAMMMSLFIATQNYFAYIERGSPRPWWFLLMLEVPVWLVWLAASPAIFAFSRRFPISGRHRWRNLLIHVPAGALAVLATLVVVVIIKTPMLRPDMPEGMTRLDLIILEYRRSLSILLIVYFGIVAIHHAIASQREAERKTLRESQLETLLERSRRDLLRMQLHPHFLFNTLHAISALMAQDTHAARRMITRLSDLLRLSLENDAAHEVTLEEEVEFLDKYLEIQKIRFGDRLTVRYDVDPSARTLLVPRLLLQPLAENAITHGLSKLEGPGTLSVEARRENGRLILRVLDDGPGVPAGGPRRQGVGLGNTRERLVQLYGADQRLVLENRPEGGAEVRVEIPASTVERGNGSA